MQSVPKVVVYEANGAPGHPLRQSFTARGLTFEQRDLVAAAREERFEAPDVAVLVVPDGEDQALEETAALLERLVHENVATLVWGAPDNVRWAGGPLVDWLDPRTTLDEIVGRLSTLARYVPLMKRFERELDHLHRLGEQLNRYFSEIDQEMRLAGRLQRDFLPQRLPAVPGFEFAALYRPASWVSGDMYDVFRLDEEHVGLFLADAMGHGVAAGLLTMFMRQALLSKRVSHDSYTLVSPPDALAELHACLVRQQLPNCQFVTAVYAILNTRTRELRLARGGHPYPLHFQRGGQIRPIRATGALLGLRDLEPDYEEVRVVLAPGEKVVFFTDGLEEDFFTGASGAGSSGTLSPRLRSWAGLTAATFVDTLRDHLDTKRGSLHPADDITALVLEATRTRDS